MEDVIIVSVVFGFVAFVLGGVFRLIRIKLQQDNGIDQELFNRMAKAFMEHKKDMERRVRNLEAIVADESDLEEEAGNTYPELEEPKQDSTLSNQLERKRRTK